jgi:hypothetical protein
MFIKESLHRLVVRTSPFHGGNTGSNPVEDITFLTQQVIYIIKIRLTRSAGFKVVKT